MSDKVSKRTAWFFLFRPWSFTATLVPFLVAAGLGSAHAGCRWISWTVGLVSGLLFQATVNLLNTWGDEKSGVDDVPGAIRTTPQVHEGHVSLHAVLTVAVVCVTLASVLGLATCFHRDGDGIRFNVPLVIAGFLGFLGATNYTTGIRFKYRGLGVPFVSFLMGPLEIFVAFAILLPASAVPALLAVTDTPFAFFSALFAVLPIAALVGVIMHGNDMRDMPTDRLAGIRTLALLLGTRGALGYYCLCHALPYLLTTMAFSLRAVDTSEANPWLLLPLLALPISVRTTARAIRSYRDNPSCPSWRSFERDSGKTLLVYGVLHALSLALR